MKHRSVIAFVLVAAGLFSLPQLSHELQSIKGAVGSRLHRELLHAFLNLPAGGPTNTAAPSARRAETLLASCTNPKSGAPAAKGGKVEAGGRAEGRTGGRSVGHRAMIDDPNNDPINNRASVDVREAAGGAVASPTGVRVETEVAMIIPPESGIDPRGLANVLLSREVARVEADALRFEADGLRVAYAAAAHAEGKGPAEWQKDAEDAFRKFNAARPGGYEFRVVRDGSKTKVLKFKCADCPAPRLTRLPRQVALSVPLPAPVAPPAPAETAGE
jgi:hypothetical protein